MGKGNWDAKRKWRAQKRRRKIGVLVRGGPDEGGREEGGEGHSHSMFLSCNN